jgi:S-adenosylmethionine decarboxylase
VAAVEEWAAKRRIELVTVRSNVSRIESHPFYQSLGYLRVKTSHVYRKRLAGAQVMEGNRVGLSEAPGRRIAPEIFRKRLLIEGYFDRKILDAQHIRDYFTLITGRLGLRTYGEPLVHQTSGQGKAENEGYDAFVPLIDSGIYVCVWSARRFTSVILYTCAEFDEAVATEVTREFFQMSELDTALF